MEPGSAITDMKGKLNIRNLLIGIVVIGLGIWLIFFPTEILQSYPVYIRVLFFIVFISYGIFRIARSGQDTKPNRRKFRY